MILLTDEEIQEATIRANSIINTYGSGSAEHWKAEYRAIAKAQLKNVVEWGEEQCQRHHTSGIWFRRRKCSKCWRALLDEVKG